MMRFACATAMAVALIAAAPASALTYLVSYTNGAGVDANFSVTLSRDGAAATAITGTRGGKAITGLSDFQSADQQLSLAAPYVSFDGLSYATADGLFNFYSSQGGLFEFEGTLNGTPTGGKGIVALSVSAASVPEPASWALMMGGFGLVGGALRGRRRVAVRFG